MILNIYINIKKENLYMKKILVLFLIGLLFLSLACDTKETSTMPTTTTKKESPEQFIFGQKGKIVVALLGIEGCPQTKISTEVLAKMSKDCSKDIVFARLDVPMQEETQFKPLTNWTYSYYQAIDIDRKVANRLEFFYYPTLYIIDRDGEVRYSGGCDKEKLKTMLSEICQEQPGTQKKIYTPPILAIGASAPLFQTKNLKDEDIELQQLLAKKPALLLFSSVSCPFSKNAAQKIPNLEKEFHGKDLTVVIIEKGTNTEVINKTYQQIKFNGIVILDSDNSISRKYGVEPVPFYFLVNKEGKITARGPYTESTARQSLNTLFEIQPPTAPPKPSTGAG